MVPVAMGYFWRIAKEVCGAFDGLLLDCRFRIIRLVPIKSFTGIKSLQWTVAILGHVMFLAQFDSVIGFEDPFNDSSLDTLSLLELLDHISVLTAPEEPLDDLPAHTSLIPDADRQHTTVTVDMNAASSSDSTDAGHTVVTVGRNRKNSEGVKQRAKVVGREGGQSARGGNDGVGVPPPTGGAEGGEMHGGHTNRFQQLAQQYTPNAVMAAAGMATPPSPPMPPMGGIRKIDGLTLKRYIGTATE
eukprot:gene30776-35815_t